MPLHVDITVQDTTYKVLKQFAEMSEFLVEQMNMDTEMIVVEGISRASFDNCLVFCEYYAGIETSDQEAMKKDITTFMTHKKYAHCSRNIKDMFDKLSKEELCDVMNTAEKLRIPLLIDVMAYIIYELTKKSNAEIVKLLSE
jgi:hypothetical protein